MTYPQPPHDPTRAYQPPPQQYAPPAPGQYPPPYGAPPGFYPPAQPAKKNPRWLKISGISVIVVVALCAIVGVIGAIFGDTSPEAKATKVPVAAVPTPTPARTVAPSPTVVASKPAVAPPPLSPVDEPVTAKMPDVKGQNARVAQDYLNKLGFMNVEFGSQDLYDSWVVLPENWTVKKQSTKAGRSIPVDTLIVLTCTKLG
jgi:hypothetical protein